MSIYFFIMVILAISVCWFTEVSSGYVNKSINAKKAFWFVIGILILIQTVRDVKVGGDLYNSYQFTIEKFGNSSYEDVCYWTDAFKYEKGYPLLTYGLYQICSNIHFVLFIIAIWYLYPLGRLIMEYSLNPFLSLFIFVSSYMYNVSMNNLRSTLAMGCVFWAIPFIIKKKYIISITLLVVAIQFHNTVASFFLLIFAAMIKTRMLLIYFVGIGAFLYWGFDTFMEILISYEPKYLVYYDTSNGGYNLMLFIVSVLIYLTVVAKKQFFSERCNEVFFRMLFLALLMQIVSLQISFFARITQYFLVSIAILLPNINNCMILNLNKKNGVFVYVLMIVFSALYVFYLINDSTGTVPYEFMF